MNDLVQETLCTHHVMLRSDLYCGTDTDADIQLLSIIVITVYIKLGQRGRWSSIGKITPLNPARGKGGPKHPPQN